MKRVEYRAFFTALGFLAAYLDKVPENQLAHKAITYTRLIESFCLVNVPEAFADQYLPYDHKGPIKELESLVDDYLESLRKEEAIELNFDRQTLLLMLDVLKIREIRHKQHEFYSKSNADIIAAKVRGLAAKQANWGQP